MQIDSLVHAFLDAESQVLRHEASLNGLYAHGLKVLSKGSQILVICWGGDVISMIRGHSTAHSMNNTHI